ncbi:beta-ketoacyl synthase N-terminal-like domain-containing protein [Streptomyces sp. NPDC059130]|uniref:beta-ketoacyl synthase N-terminal-like domain-containing protein n=1 Tax=Streptomyces sp. NPDC059130 TaxID=3346735 RepID=UPI00369A2CAA
MVKPHSAPIAVVGLACRLPGAPDPAGFWRLLHRGEDAIGEAPADRWSGGAAPPAGLLVSVVALEFEFCFL